MNPRSFEHEILEVVTQMVASKADLWDELALSPVVNPIERSAAEGPAHQSEISVYFWDQDKNVFDVLEFHVFFEGKQVASRQEIEAWLRVNLEDVVQRRRRQRGAV